MNQIYISQGEEAVSDDAAVVITTVLGSCVSICLWDPDRKIGGMNHLLLPELASSNGGVDTVGAIAMERLINRMVRQGAERRVLRSKVFGGASMLSGITDIGHRNVTFAKEYLSREGIPCDAESLGGSMARRLKFWPASGHAKQRLVNSAPALRPLIEPRLHEVEMF